MRHTTSAWSLTALLIGSLLPCSPAPAQTGDSPAARQAQSMFDVQPDEPTATDEYDRTALHYAALAGDAKLIQTLLESGADIAARDRWGDTPLHTAARRFRAQAAEVLLAHGAALDARNAAGETPLLVGANHGGDGDEIDVRLAAFAQLLLDAGADVNALDAQECSALQYAQARQHNRLAQVLREAGGKAGPGTVIADGGRANYHTYPEVEADLAAAASNYPDICRLQSIGQTTQGRDMWALKITDNPDAQEDEPEFRYISTMHGNEIIGVELCLYLVDYLTSNYGIDPRVTNLVDELEIWIVPCMNPDGFVSGSRYNAQGVDLNRDFPDPYTSPNNTPDGRAPETANIMIWSFGQSFTLSANYHSGALVVNYPFDNNENHSDTYTPTPDDDLMIWISEEYSQHNSPMWNSASFYHGITNGAAWYSISGGLQDWSYVYMGCNDVTIEAADYTPPASQIPTYWNNNRESMLAYMETAFVGVRGIVTDASIGVQLAATIAVVGRDHDVFTDPDVGDYHRMLEPGTYDLRFEATGYDPLIITDVIVNAGDATRLDVGMGQPAQVMHPNGGEQLPMGSPALIEWTGSGDAQFHVQCTFNAGDMQTTTDGFERGSLGADYATGGNASWSIAQGTSHGGTRAARAGNINDYGVTWMTRSIANGGDLSFWYKVSSESGYDFFNFYIDGDRKIHASGEVDWTQYTTSLSPGSHELKWEYTKDVSWDSGSDTAWIDDLQVVDDNTIWEDVVALTGVGDTSVSWIPDETSDSAKVRVRAYYGDGIYGDWDASDDVFAVVDGDPCPGDLDGDGHVNQADLGLLLSAYGQDDGGDLDGDGDTDQADLGFLLSHYGDDCV